MRHFHRKRWLLCTNRAVNKSQWRPLHKSNEKLIRSDRYVLVIVDVHTKTREMCNAYERESRATHDFIFRTRWQFMGFENSAETTWYNNPQNALTMFVDQHCDFYLQIEYTSICTYRVYRVDCV